MILINLLPSELRVQEESKVQIPYRAIAIAVFGIFLFITVINLLMYVQARQKLSNLQKQWDRIADQYSQAQLLEVELGTQLAAEVNFYDRRVDPPLETARLLNFIGDLIPSNLWLKDLKFERKESELKLTLSGISDSTRVETKLIEIQNFSNGLKSQMEAYLDPRIQMTQTPKREIKTTLTTTSQKSESKRGEVTQFNALFQTEGFEKSKK